MSIKLMDLPFSVSDLEPYMSRTTMDYHYGKHHRGYVEMLNKLIRKTPYDKLTLEEIVLESSDRYGIDKKIFNNAAQVWNHNFFWKCLTGDEGREPSSDFCEVIESNFDSLDNFTDMFSQAAEEHFGSGWAWLVKTDRDQLSIETLENADTPLTQGLVPLLTCDVWEHAYYLDYKNERKKYVENFWSIVNWAFVEECFESADVRRQASRSYRKPQEEGYTIEP